MALTPTQREFADDFEALEDELEKFTYLTALGNLLGTPTDDTLCTDNFLVRGCQSETWLRISLSAAPEGAMLDVEAYSDTLIVRGLLYLLRECANGMPPCAFHREDFTLMYETAGLSELLSAPRRSGLSSIIAEAERQVAGLAGTA